MECRSSMIVLIPEVAVPDLDRAVSLDVTEPVPDVTDM
jgi:hypothetical protein